MNRHLPLLRKFHLLMLIPLILINGRVSAGCICMDGHFKLFCGGHACCHGTSDDKIVDHTAASPCCVKSGAVRTCCGHSCPDCNLTKSSACSVTFTSSGCCRQLELIPATLTEADSLEIDSGFPAWDHVFLFKGLPRPENTERARFWVFAPPRERLKLYQRLLI